MRQATLCFFTLLLLHTALTQCSKGGQPDPPAPPAGNRILTDAEVTALQSVGMDTTQIERLIQAVKSNEYPNIHSVLIAKNKKLVFERYFSGRDENFGTNLGIVNHSAATLHDVRSISKSVVSACIGIAFSKGLLSDMNQNIFDFFPEYEVYKTGLRAQITLKHLLEMSAGLEWNENLPYTDARNSEIQMTNATDPIEFVLSRPMVATPGQVWNYSGGTTQLLGAIIKKLSGKEIVSFANEFLFTPLGITDFVWNKYSRSGQAAAASGLRLRSGDLMKFGLLYHNEGKVGNTQLIPASWVLASHTAQINRAVGGYGYQFYILPPFTISGRQMTLPAALGNGDQRIFFDKPNDLVVVVTAGNYNQSLAKNAMALTRDFIYPSIF